MTIKIVHFSNIPKNPEARLPIYPKIETEIDTDNITKIVPMNDHQVIIFLNNSEEIKCFPAQNQHIKHIFKEFINKE